MLKSSSQRHNINFYIPRTLLHEKNFQTLHLERGQVSGEHSQEKTNKQNNIMEVEEKRVVLSTVDKYM